MIKKLQLGTRLRQLPDRVRIGASIALAAVAVAAVAFSVLPERITGTPAEPIWPSTGAGTNSPAAVPGQAPDSWTKQVDAAVVATAWPKLNPPLDKLSRSRAAEWDACRNVTAGTEAKCRFGKSNDPKKTVVILGDSLAISWIPAARAGFESKGWTVRGLTFKDCPAARIDVVPISRDVSFTEDCRKHQEYALARAKALKPAIVLISTGNGTLTRILGSQGPEAAAALQQAETTAIKSLVTDNTKVVVVAPPPDRRDMGACATHVSTPADCLSDVQVPWNTLRTLEQDAAKQAGGVYLNTQSWTCTLDGQCPSFIGTTPVMTDGVHLTNSMSRRLGTVLFDAATARA
ncbi:MAG: SGNH hydrolase domain-containing protein [Micropruina sp.]|uniref:SGNH hydrolase domain-containing protein n=1 Tax=Micropruina sp. TaxID=2737536 RepID=UPI0039E337ED